MTGTWTRTLTISAILSLFAGTVSGGSGHPHADSGLIAHEWGTFTTMQGANGAPLLLAQN